LKRDLAIRSPHQRTPESDVGQSGYFTGLGAFAIATAIFASASAQAAPRRILTAELPTVVAARAALRAGAPDPTQQIHLAIALPMRNQAGLEALIAQIYDPKSPLYRHYLTVSEFADRFGPAPADYQKALGYFRAAGFQIAGPSANRYLIDAVGNVRNIERVFHVKMGLYQHPTEARQFFAPDREPTVDVDVPLLAVEGLDNFELPKPRLMQASVRATRTGSGPQGYFIPSDIRAAYRGKSKLTGAGQSLGLMELEGYNLSDVQHMFQKFGQPLKPNVVAISTDGSPTTCGKHCDDGEQVLDIEYAIGMAPNLRRVQVYVANSALSVLNRMASDNTSAQLSTSWGWGHHPSSDDPLFLEMQAQGQTFLTASGDDSSLRASGPWPEEDANITAVGGTDLRTQGAGGSWASETGWADSAGGPSVDKTITIPLYQRPYINGSNGGSMTLRNVPDIAGDAGFDNYICANGGCDGGWGGTSFASPIWAGYIALANERAAKLGKPRVGFLNPTLYSIGDGQAKFLHDVTSGKSGKYHAVLGYDLVTGLGSPASDSLIEKLANSGE
jgi:subtilase family serine protease